MRKTAAVFLVALGMAGGVFAQDTPTNIKNTTLDTSVPESPALTVLGLTPSTVTRPASPRSLASSLLNGVDKNGNLQTGVAIDTVPYMLLYGNQITLQDFQSNKIVRVLARTGLSLATTKGSSDADKSAKLAIGVNVTVFDKGDPRSDAAYLTQLTTVAQQVLFSVDPLPPNATPEQVKKRNDEIASRVEEGTKAIRAAQQKISWNRSSWVIAAAPSWISSDGSASSLEANGAAVWTSLAYGFEGVPGLKDNAQLIIHGRFHSRESVPDPQAAGKFFDQESTVAGARLRFGTSTTIGSLEAAYVHVKPVDRATDDYLRVSVGAEERLSDNVWLHFSIGGESGQKNGQNKLFILGAFQWAAGPKE